jgi:hypothetical protein
MCSFGDQIRTAALELGKSVTPLPESRRELMRDKIYATFTKGNKSFDTPLWELMSSEESYHDEGSETVK